MAENVMVDSHVWVEDPDVAWIDGVVVDIKGDVATVKTNDDREVFIKKKQNTFFFFFIFSL